MSIVASVTGMDPHGRRMAMLREAAPIVVAVLLLVVIAPNMMSDFRLNLLSKYLCYAIIAIGIDLIWGYTGMLSLGQAVWFGLGGYAMAMYLKLIASGESIPDFMNWSGRETLPWFWVPFEFAWFALPMALIGPGILAFLLGMLVFRSRVKGAYFAIVTQALAVVMGILFVGEQGRTGGTSGITNFSTIFGHSISADETQNFLYFVTVAALGVTFAFASWMTRSRFGRLMIAIRDDEDRVRFAGYNVALVKSVVYGVSAAMAGLAGALFVPQVGAITPTSLGIVPSIEYVLLVAVGGRATLSGAVIGAVVVSWARTRLSEEFPETWQYFYGALFIGAVLLFPTGIVGMARKISAEIGARVGARRGGAGSGSTTPLDVEARSVTGAE
ncbi:MAG: urea ABC transporter permease subunit UrtC [Tepidiformaceae bacterium]